MAWPALNLRARGDQPALTIYIYIYIYVIITIIIIIIIMCISIYNVPIYIITTHRGGG